MTDTSGAAHSFAIRRRVAAQIAGLHPHFPISPHEAYAAQKFSSLWPYLQAKYLHRADALIAALGGNDELA